MALTRALISSSVPWLKFRRNTEAPASTSFSSISGDWLAGPVVAMILQKLSCINIIYLSFLKSLYIFYYFWGPAYNTAPP